MNSFLSGIFTIDAFQTSANTGNELQIGGFVDEGFVNFKAASDNDSLIILNFGFNDFFGRNKILVIFKTSLLQLFPQQMMIAVDMKDFYCVWFHF